MYYNYVIKNKKEHIMNINPENIITAKKSVNMTVVTSLGSMVNNSVFKATNKVTINTDINGYTEAKATADEGDYIAKGDTSELWVIKGENFDNLYDIRDGIAYPKQVKYFYLVNLDNDKTWENAYGDTMNIPANKDYYLMANDVDAIINLDWVNINPMDVDVFNNTYAVQPAC